MEKLYGPYCNNRRERFAEFLRENNIAAAVFEDTEGRRDPSVRYFTGQPGDAILVITAQADAILCPWDENMAQEMAVVPRIIPLTHFRRNNVEAVKGLLKELKVPVGSRIDIPPVTPYPLFLKFVDALSDYTVLCREEGVHQHVADMRSIKDEYEINCIKKAAAITDGIIDHLEEAIKDNKINTELDVALFIEKECRQQGCERTGFETLAAGPDRSFGIHCFPPFTAGTFADRGLSILDFGVVYQGYTSDVTLTVARVPLTQDQENQLELVQKAYDQALELYKNGLPIHKAAEKADAVFAKGKRSMPHALGHSFGLEAHEWPTVRPTIDEKVVFKPGMVVTLEPGLYDLKNGGCRLENDILITEEGSEVITHSRIIRF